MGRHPDAPPVHGHITAGPDGLTLTMSGRRSRPGEWQATYFYRYETVRSILVSRVRRRGVLGPVTYTVVTLDGDPDLLVVSLYPAQTAQLLLTKLRAHGIEQRDGEPERKP